MGRKQNWPLSITENGCHKAFALAAVREVLRTNRTFLSHHVTRAAPATSSQGPRIQEKIDSGTEARAQPFRRGCFGVAKPHTTLHN